MRKWLLTLLLGLFAVGLSAQEPYPALGAKLEEYFTALSGEPTSVQIEECDYLISSSEDAKVRQYVALKIYDHYLKSKIMGDDAVAVHVAEKWFLSGDIPMNSPGDLFNAQMFVEFNRSSLIGSAAPSLTLLSPEGDAVKVPGEGYSVLYFYDTGCSTCKMETPRLKNFVREGKYPVTVYAIYTGSDKASWDSFRDSFPGVTHLWDPEIDSDWQRLYGVLQTPKMFLVSPAGIILGRGLDTPALEILLNREMGTRHFVYGEDSQMENFAQLFAPYGDTLKVQDVLDVADYMAARTAGEGSETAFKQLFGDFLYYLSSQKNEVYRDAVIPFVQKYITGMPSVWNTADDQAQVVSLGEMLSELAARTPVGSPVPDLKVPGQLRRRPCLFRPASKDGVFSLRSISGNPAYVVFYTGGCSACQELLGKVDSIVQENRKAKVLLIDMDALMNDDYDKARELLDNFDLSGLPFVLELDKKGTVVHKYVDL